MVGKEDASHRHRLLQMLVAVPPVKVTIPSMSLETLDHRKQSANAFVNIRLGIAYGSSPVRRLRMIYPEFEIALCFGVLDRF